MNTEQIKVIRDFLNMSQEELADRLHVSSRQYQRYESGETLIPKIRERLLQTLYEEAKKRELLNANKSNSLEKDQLIWKI